MMLCIGSEDRNAKSSAYLLTNVGPGMSSNPRAQHVDAMVHNIEEFCNKPAYIKFGGKDWDLINNKMVVPMVTTHVNRRVLAANSSVICFSWGTN